MKERFEVILWGKAGMWHAGCKALNINCIKKIYAYFYGFRDVEFLFLRYEDVGSYSDAAIVMYFRLH